MNVRMSRKHHHAIQNTSNIETQKAMVANYPKGYSQAKK